MKLGWTVAAIALILLVIGQTGPTADKAKHSSEILKKARHLDILNHMLPLVLTKAQIDKLLPALERCRAREAEVQGKEADVMRTMEAKIDAALDKGINNGTVPPKELLQELNKMFIAFSMSRQAVSDENTDAILALMKAEFNPGQLKAAQNSIDPKAYDPGAKPEEMTQDERLRFFIKAVMLDGACYDVLVKLSAKK
jgi:hypothetical protein